MWIKVERKETREIQARINRHYLKPVPCEILRYKLRVRFEFSAWGTRYTRHYVCSRDSSLKDSHLILKSECLTRASFKWRLLIQLSETRLLKGSHDLAVIPYCHRSWDDVGNATTVASKQEYAVVASSINTGLTGVLVDPFSSLNEREVRAQRSLLKLVLFCFFVAGRSRTIRSIIGQPRARFAGR